jgi:hypothetical protein
MKNILLYTYLYKFIGIDIIIIQVAHNCKYIYISIKLFFETVHETVSAKKKN